MAAPGNEKKPSSSSKICFIVWIPIISISACSTVWTPTGNLTRSFSGGTADYAQKLNNKARCAPLASAPRSHIGLRAIESGIVDVILFSINPAYDLLLDGLGFYRTPL